MYKQALIGCGSAAQQYLRQLAAESEIVAVCDIDQSKSSSLASELGCLSYSDIGSLLSEVPFDALVVCTPTGLHAEHSIKALQAGRDVLCSPPLCLTSAAAWQITETEKYCGKKLNVLGCEFGELVATLKDNIHAGSLQENISIDGEVAAAQDPASWRYQQFPGGGHLYNSLYSVVAALTRVLGKVQTAQTVLQTNADPQQIEKAGHSIVSFEKGSVLQLNWLETNTAGSCQLTICSLSKKTVLHYDERTLSSEVSGLTANASSLSLTSLEEARSIVENIEKIYAGAQSKPDAT